tara:strand:- start:1756 stop:3066 length:1311 start_codon:yes stop_codon:yes gene_type:complete
VVKVKLVTVSTFLVILLCTVFGISYFFRNIELAETKTLKSGILNSASIERGQNLVAIGNCMGCHTASSDEPYAGGYSLKTQFGTIYSTNITPDQETGIGSWSYAAFKRAMTKGINRKGEHLYPVFPYEHFSKMTDSDIRDIYSYIMALEPIEKEKIENNLSFPFNIRKLLIAWKFIFLDDEPIKEDINLTDEQNHGAYLVKSLAHCSACHSPRNSFGAIKNKAFLGGAVIDGWYAPPIGPTAVSPLPWTKDHYFSYLYDGWSESHGISKGLMTSVVDQLFDANEEDIDSIADFLTTLGTISSSSESIELPLSTEIEVLAKNIKSAKISNINDFSYLAGQTIFLDNCKKCHHKKTSDNTPFSLAFSTTLNSPNPINFINIIKDGIHPPIAQPMRRMPSFNKKINDEDIIYLADYLRTNFTKNTNWKNMREYLNLPKK